MSKKKKAKQDVRTFYTECERWLEKNRKSIGTAVQKRLSERIGPIGTQTNKKVYCSKASFRLSVCDIHNPQLEVQVQYTLCEGEKCCPFHEAARAGLSNLLDIEGIQKRLCKNLSKSLAIAADTIASQKITQSFLAEESENHFFGDNSQNASIFYAECEQWLKKNRKSIETAVQKRLNERIGPIGTQSNKQVYCSEASFCLSVYDIHNPQLEVQVQYTLCEGKKRYLLRKTARAGLSTLSDTEDIQKRLCKNLSKHLSAAASVLASQKIPQDFLSAEAENLPAAFTPSPVKQEPVKPSAPTVKDIQDAFCTLKTSGSYWRNMEKYLLGVFSEYFMEDSSLDIHVSAEVCKGGVQFRASAVLFFPCLRIPLPKICAIVTVEPRYLSLKTKEECLGLFEKRAKAELGELLKEQLAVFAKKQFFYHDCKEVSFSDPGCGAKMLLEKIKRTITPEPDAMVQVHWKGMDYPLEKSAVFIGDDGKARVYIDGTGRPVYTGIFSNGRFQAVYSYEKIDFLLLNNRFYWQPPYPQNIFDFFGFLVSMFPSQRNDIPIVFDMDPDTMKIFKIKIGFAEYDTECPEWFLPEQQKDMKEFRDRLYAELKLQRTARSRITNEEGFTNAELQILQFLQEHPHRGKTFIVANTDVPELKKAGRELAFDGKIQKLLVKEKNQTYYIHPQYANLSFSKFCPATYPSDYSDFLRADALPRLFERQLASARLLTECVTAFKTLMQTREEYQLSFLQTEQAKIFLEKFSKPDVDFEVRKYVRFCLCYMPEGRKLEASVFAAEIEEEIIHRLNAEEDEQLDSLDYLRTVPPPLADRALQSERGRSFLKKLTGKAVEDAEELLSQLPNGESLIKILLKEQEVTG